MERKRSMLSSPGDRNRGKHNAGGMPRYLQLSMLFRRHISSGTWENGAQIPTVDELAGECGVARATVRQALGILEKEGLIERYRARGTFVTYTPQDHLWCEVETDWNGLLRSREGAVIEVLSEEAGQQPPNVLHKIGERARSYHRLTRRHSRHGVPFLLADVYFDEALFKRIQPEAFTTKSSLSILAGMRGIDIADVRQTLTMGSADVFTAQQLEIPLSAPVAYVHRSAVDRNGRLVFVTDGIYRGDVVRIDIKLK